MCYKEEVQKRNEEKLQKMFQKDGTPEFIQRLFTNLGESKATSINYWIAIRDMLQYMIDFNIITKEKIADIFTAHIDCFIEKYATSKLQNNEDIQI